MSEFGFTQQQLDGLSVMSGHLAEAINPTTQPAAITVNAADPFSGRQLAIEQHADPKRKSIWERTGDCNQIKKHKKEQSFIKNLGFTHQE